MTKKSYASIRASILFKEIEVLTPYKLSKREEGYKVLAIREADLLMKQYPDGNPEAKRYYNTAYSKIAVIKKEMLYMMSSLKDPAYTSSMKTLITKFTEDLYFHFSVYKKRYNDYYKSVVKTRSLKENRIKVSPQFFLEKAKLILEYIPQDTKGELNWADISCAIALTTGRRMSEIHLSGDFKQIDDYTLSFKGQLNGNNKLKDVLFQIPTLIPAHLIIDGISWLELNNKRLSTSPKNVNSRFSKSLSERCKGIWCMWSYEDFTYHHFRSVYILCACHNYIAKTGNILDLYDYIKSIVGDEDFDSIRSSYSRFFIAKDQKTLI